MDDYPQLRLGNQLCFPLYAASKEIVRRYSPVLEPFGLTYTQYIVMMALWERKEITVSDLGSMLYLDSGTLTPVLKKLESNGYVIRSRKADDERCVIVSPTEEGWKLRERLAMVPAEVGSCVRLTPDEAKTLYGLLYKILKGL